MPISTNTPLVPPVTVVGTPKPTTLPPLPPLLCKGNSPEGELVDALKEAKAKGLNRGLALSVAAIAKNEVSYYFRLAKPPGSVSCCECVLPIGLEPIFPGSPEWSGVIGRVMAKDLPADLMYELESEELLQRSIRTTEKGTATYLKTFDGRTKSGGLAAGNSLVLEKAVKYRSLDLLRAVAFGPTQLNLIWAKILKADSPTLPENWDNLWYYYVNPGFSRFLQVAYSYLNYPPFPADMPADRGNAIRWLAHQIGNSTEAERYYDGDKAYYKDALAHVIAVAESAAVNWK